MHGKIKSIGMEIRESKERADVEEVFRKKGGTKWKKRNWKEASENQRFPDLRGEAGRRPGIYSHRGGGYPGGIKGADRQKAGKTIQAYIRGRAGNVYRHRRGSAERRRLQRGGEGTL